MRDEEVRVDMRSNVATNRGFACERSLAVLGPPPDRCAALPTLPSTLYPLLYPLPSTLYLSSRPVSWSCISSAVPRRQPLPHLPPLPDSSAFTDALSEIERGGDRGPTS